MSPADTTSRTTRLRRAVTLVELVLSLALTTIVVGAATSVMFVASRALPRPGDAAAGITDANAALAVMESELQCARRVRVQPASLTIVLEGLGGVGERTVVYAWDGNANSTLTRTEAGVTIDLITGVNSAAFASTPARGKATRVGVIYTALMLKGNVQVLATVRPTSEPEVIP